MHKAILCCDRLARGYTGLACPNPHAVRLIMTIRRILFPVDFSERAKAVAPFVLSLALRHKAAVVLMNIIQPPPPLYGGINMVYPETFDFTEARLAVAESLERFAVEELPKIEISSVVDVGDPASLIIDFANDNISVNGFGID